MTFATLSEAIDWTREHWHAQRPVPIRIHSHETEGIGLFYAPAFAAAMDGSPAASVTVTIPNQPCYHPTLVRGDSPFQCSECHGSGMKDHRTDRYLYPMSLALTRLATVPPVRRHLHPYALVVALVSAGWDWRSAARSIDRSEDAAEALFLPSSWNRDNSPEGRTGSGIFASPMGDPQCHFAVPIASPIAEVETMSPSTPRRRHS
jgi:hypothetical protein